MAPRSRYGHNPFRQPSDPRGSTDERVAGCDMRRSEPNRHGGSGQPAGTRGEPPAEPDAPGENGPVAVVGAGYVGLVTAACLARQGLDVAIVDRDPRPIGALRRGRTPIPEPRLSDLLCRHRERIRFFSTNLAEVIPEATAVLLSVGTPEGTDGLPDLTDLEAAVRETSPLLRRSATLVIRSTVLPGTTKRMAKIAAEAAGWPVPVGVVPEFLAEGRAVEDFLSPDRIVIGADDARTERRLRSLFARRAAPVFVMDSRSAETMKYAANAMLAVRVSFANEIAEFAVAQGASVGRVLDAVGADHRIGPQYLKPGVGYGGSCLPKDTRALIAAGRRDGSPLRLVEAANRVNAIRRGWPYRQLAARVGSGARIAIWGVAFKEGVADIRDAVSMELIPQLLQDGHRVAAYAPLGLAEMARAFDLLPEQSAAAGVVLATNPLDCLHGADACVVLTAEDLWKGVDRTKMRAAMKGRVIVDGHGTWDAAIMAKEGWDYACPSSVRDPSGLPSPVPADYSGAKPVWRSAHLDLARGGGRLLTDPVGRALATDSAE